MKLVFKINIQGNLEKTLAAARYSKFWDDNKVEILNSFYMHTGLKFKQRRITVHIREDGRSFAGSNTAPMDLSMTWNTKDEIGLTLIHELSHRLIIGNGIEPSTNSKHGDERYNYYVHRQLYLFLYDVYVDILGSEAADEEVRRESAPGPKKYYGKAWKWALQKDYKQRQATFKRIKRYYLKNASIIKQK